MGPPDRNILPVGIKGKHTVFKYHFVRLNKIFVCNHYMDQELYICSSILETLFDLEGAKHITVKVSNYLFPEAYEIKVNKDKSVIDAITVTENRGLRNYALYFSAQMELIDLENSLECFYLYVGIDIDDI